MKNKSAEKYSTVKKKKADPLIKKEDVAKNPDHKIDEDFPGFPHGHSSEKIIHPITTVEKKIAGVISNTPKANTAKKIKPHRH